MKIKMLSRFIPLCLIAFACALSSASAADRPNIVIIMADDLGYADLSFLAQSPPDVDTPFIDQETGQRDNTILVFVSDNGGTINTYSNNAPLRGYKYMFGEGGVRIPIIVSWPGRLPQGQRRSGLTSAMDVFPTVVELVGGESPENLDGQSLVPSFNEKADERLEQRNDGNSRLDAATFSLAKEKEMPS